MPDMLTLIVTAANDQLQKDGLHLEYDEKSEYPQVRLRDGVVKQIAKLFSEGRHGEDVEDVTVAIVGQYLVCWANAAIAPADEPEHPELQHTRIEIAHPRAFEMFLNALRKYSAIMRQYHQPLLLQ